MNLSKICKMWNLTPSLGGVLFLMAVCLFRPGLTFKLYDILSDHKNFQAIRRELQQQQQSPTFDVSVVSRTEQCLQENCEPLVEAAGGQSPGDSARLQEICILNCLVAAADSLARSSVPDLIPPEVADDDDDDDGVYGGGKDLRDRELNMAYVCIQVRCPDLQGEPYWQCVTANCPDFGALNRKRDVTPIQNRINPLLLARLFPADDGKLADDVDDAADTKVKRRRKILSRRQVDKRPVDLCTQCYPNDPVGHYPECRNTCG